MQIHPFSNIDTVNVFLEKNKNNVVDVKICMQDYKSYYYVLVEDKQIEERFEK